jgi:hypothetical protein
MNVTLSATVVLAALAFAGPGRAAENFVVDRSSVVAFGTEGGDTFGLERVFKNRVFVLFQPRGEDCTLRFPLNVGETLRLRAGSDGTDKDLVCEASLLSIDKKSHTTFSARCSTEPASHDKKCPRQSTEASTPLPAPVDTRK